MVARHHRQRVAIHIAQLGFWEKTTIRKTLIEIRSAKDWNSEIHKYRQSDFRSIYDELDFSTNGSQAACPRVEDNSVIENNPRAEAFTNHLHLRKTQVLQLVEAA